jgi:hypothetical protein
VHCRTETAEMKVNPPWKQEDSTRSAKWEMAAGTPTGWAEITVVSNKQISSDLRLYKERQQWGVLRAPVQPVPRESNP